MNFKKPAEAIQPWLEEQRHWLHRHPELSFQEWETTKYIVSQLEAMDIPVTTFPDYPGCIGHIKGSKPGKTVMLRADIDALPTVENSGVEFASENPGVMHACGHDCHAAMLLGAAQLLCLAFSALLGQVGDMLLWPLTGAGAATLTLYALHLVTLDLFSEVSAPLPRNLLFIIYAVGCLLFGLVLKFLGRRGPLEALVHSVSRTLGRAS